MSAGIYRPHPTSLAAKVAGFFQANRDEELDAVAIAEKFSCARTGVHTSLLPALSAGWLRRIEDPGTEEVLYTAGPQLPEPASGTVAKATQTAAEKRRAHLNIDLTQVQIDKDVPLPARNGRSPLNYAVLLDRLVAIGDSAELPKQARTGLSRAIRDRKESGQGFTLRSDDTTLRVWRTA